MPAGMWLGTFFAFCAFGAVILEAAGLLGFIAVDYSKANVPPKINLFASLPVALILIVSVIGFFKKAKWARITAISIWPLIGIYSVFKNWWIEGFVLITLIEIITITTVITAISWCYFYKRQNVINYFTVENNT